MAISALIGALRVTLGLDSAAFEKGAKKAEAGMAGLGKSMSKLGSQFQKTGAIMTAAVTAPLAVFGRAAFNAAVDAEELQSAFNYSFGQMAEGMNAWAVSTGDAMGRSTQALQQQALTFNQLFKAAAPTQAVAADLSKQFVLLANDLSSFFNVTESTALEKLRAGLVGEAEPLRAFGVFMSEAALKTKAAELGIKAVSGAFSEQQKILLRAAVIMDQTKDAQGDLERTSDSTANQLRRSQAAWQELSVIIGTQLIPVLTPVITTIAGIIEQLSQLNPSIVQAALVAGLLAAAIGPVALAIGTVLKLLPALIIGIKGMGIALRFLALNPVGLVISAIAIVITALGKWGAVFDWIKEKIAAFARWLGVSVPAAAKKAATQTKATAASGFADMSGVIAGALKDVPGAVGNAVGGAKTQKAIAAATKRVRDALAGIGEQVQRGFDDVQLPESIEKAEALRRKIDEIAASAREAGIGMAQFSGQVATLRARIAELETVGLQKEAESFAAAVARQASAAKEFASGGLAPLAERLAEVDDRYERLRVDIEAAIAENEKLAEVNETAARSMAMLSEQLAQLERAHEKATEAAIAQHRAEQAIADLEARREQAGIASDIAELRLARGDLGPVSAQADEMRRIEQQLNEERLSAQQRLLEMEAQRAEAERVGDTDAVARQQGIIDLQRVYHEEVLNTTATQILAAQRIQDAFDDFASSLSNSLSNMIMEWDFSLKSISDVFRKLANDLFIKPGTDALSGFLSSALGSLSTSFAGGFASGGVIPRGQWGIVGEDGPEVAFGGRSAMTVLPSGAGGGVTQIFNISSPDANSFRASERQIARASRQRMGMA